MNKQLSYLIVGNGIAGVTAAETLRLEDPTCSITMVADDPFPAYYRPALKDYLAGRLEENKLWARPSSFYRQHHIRFIPGRVVHIDPHFHTVHLHNGRQGQYDKLLLAHGARPRHLACPGTELAGVMTLRTVADYQQVRQHLQDARRIVICGSGTLALETAEALHHQGYEVTHLLRNSTIWSEILDDTASDLVLQEERRSGVEVRTHEEIAEIIGKNGRVNAVLTTKGARIPCDLVLIAIGIEPLIDFAQAAGIECGLGIKVDPYMRTNIPDIFAAGDVIETRDELTGRTRVIGQWYPAIQQAQTAAYSMLGLSDIHQPASTGTFYNATFLWGLNFVSIGLTKLPPNAFSVQEVVADPAPRTYRKVLLHNGVAIGALFLGDRKQALAFKRAIDHRANLTPVANRLFADDFNLDAWLDEQRVPPVISAVSSSAWPAPGAYSPPSMPDESTAGAVLFPIPHPKVAVSFENTSLHLPHNAKIVTIGRQADVEISIPHRSVSRQHAEISCVNGTYELRDTGSSNGTFVNGTRLPPFSFYTLQKHDKLRFGDVQFRFEPRKPVDTSAPSIVVGLQHRSDTHALSQKQVQFEIDMCIGCDRCMAACPLPLSSQVSIADLNHATVTSQVAPHVARFTHECILCGSCVPVCPVDNHRDLLMVSLKQRLGVSWEGKVDEQRLLSMLPDGWTLPLLIGALRQQHLLRDTQLILDNYLLHLAAASQFLSLMPGAIVLEEGEYERDLYLILQGSLEVSTMDADNQRIPTAILGQGEFIGEYGMLTGQPHHATVRVQTPALLLQVPEQVIHRLMELVPGVQDFFTQWNNTRSLKSILKRMALFQGLPDQSLQFLIAQTQIKQYDRNARLFTEESSGRPARETLHILLEGFVKVARRKTGRNGERQEGERIIAYRQGGDYFAGGLDLLGDSRAVTVTAINRTRVAEVPSHALLMLFREYPEVEQRFKVRLREYIATTVSMEAVALPSETLKLVAPASSTPDTSRKVGLHELVSDGVVEGTEVLIIDLNKCIHCDECVEACTRRHGHSRMNRIGKVIGNISIATACRQCQDPVCMLCSRAGIARHPDGEVYITETCIGCGICAERCPYGAISIVDVEDEVNPPASWLRFNNLLGKSGDKKTRKRSPLPMANNLSTSKHLVAPGPLDVTVPRDAYEEMRKKIAIKCDLCAGYSDQACVESCPVGAALRVQPTEFFGTTEEILRR